MKRQESGARDATVGPSRRAQAAIVTVVLALVSLAPALLYALVFGGAPAASAREARRLLAAPRPAAVLVDVRPAATFATRHLEGAVNLPSARVMALASAADLPEPLASGRLFLLCDSGIAAAQAARRLAGLGVDAAYVQGGLQDWIAAEVRSKSEPSVFVSGSGAALPYPARDLPRSEQVVIVAAYLGLKPLYMLLSLGLIVVLRRGRARDLQALQWALMLFLAGEVACAVAVTYFFLLNQTSDLAEYLHGLTMALCMGLVAYAAIEAIDRRLLHFSDPQKACALAGLCRGCSKHSDRPCGLRRSLLLATPMLAVLALLPLTAPIIEGAFYNATIFNMPYSFSHSAIQQVFEIRCCPVLAAGALAISALVLLLSRGRQDWLARVLFATGVGALALSLLRGGLMAFFHDNQVWFVFWEEATEMMFVGAAAALLWIFAWRRKNS